MYVAAIVGACTWSLWTRRLAFGNHWERDTNAALVLIFGGAALITPALGIQALDFLSLPSGRFFLHTQLLLGSAFLLAGLGRICLMLIRRVIEEPGATRIIRRRVDLPSAVGLALAALCFAMGGAAHDPHALVPSSDSEPYNGWIRASWIMVSLSIGYLMLFSARVLLILRQEPRHRPVADIYLFACVMGLVAQIVGIVGIAALGRLTTPMMVVLAVSDVLWIGGFVLGAAYSWRRKLAPVDPVSRALKDH